MEIKFILLDTNAYTAFKRNVSDAVEVIKNAPLIGGKGIASTALQHDLALFSYDKHFQGVEGLTTGVRLSNFKII